jgi:hypothetical protein
MKSAHRFRVLLTSQLILVPIALLSATVLAYGAQIARNSIGPAQLRTNSVTSLKIAPRAVGNGDLALNAVTSATIRNRTIQSSDIREGSIGSVQLAASSVTASSLAPSSVSTVAIADGAITASKLAPGAVTAFQLAAGDVTESIIAQGAVTASRLADGAVTSAKLANGAVTSTKLADGAAVDSIYDRTFVVRSGDDPLANGTRLQQAVAAATALGEPALVDVEPGAFDLDESSLSLTAEVVLRGAGPTLTTIVSSGAAATLSAAGRVESVYVINDAATTSTAIEATSSSFELVDARAKAGTSVTSTATGVAIGAGAIVRSTVESEAEFISGASRAVRTTSTGPLTITDSKLVGGGTTESTALLIPNHAELVEVNYSMLQGGTHAIRVQAFANSSAILLRGALMEGDVTDAAAVPIGRLVATHTIFRGDDPADTWSGSTRSCIGSHQANSFHVVLALLDEDCAPLP